MIFRKSVRTLILSILTVLTGVSFVSCTKVYHVGDVVLEDGTVLSKAAFASYKGSSKPEAVIFSLHGGDSEKSNRVLGVMLRDAGQLKFADRDYIQDASWDSDFNATMIVNQVFDEEKGIYKNSGFTGGPDGRYIGYNLNAEDKEKLEELTKAYYAVSACKDQGAYLPAAAELYMLFENAAVVNDSIKTAGGNVIAEGVYWSASCDFEDDRKQFTVDMKTGQVVSEKRNEVHNVRGIKCYTGKKADLDVSYNIGDIVLDNGKVINRDKFINYTGNAKPVAIIFSLRGGHFEETRRVLGVGLNASDPLVFASEGSTGQITNFTLNQAITISEKFNIEKGFFVNAGVTGVKNGEKSWENVCKMDNGSHTDISAYPAYNYAVNYGKNNGFKKFEKGWYLPSSMETYELFRYLQSINRSLKACGAKPIPAAVWTSTQNYYVKNNQYLQDMQFGEIQVGFKSNSYPVIAVYCFEKIKKAEID